MPTNAHGRQHCHNTLDTMMTCSTHHTRISTCFFPHDCVSAGMTPTATPFCGRGAGTRRGPRATPTSHQSAQRTNQTSLPSFPAAATAAMATACGCVGTRSCAWYTRPASQSFYVVYGSLFAKLASLEAAAMEQQGRTPRPAPDFGALTILCLAILCLAIPCLTSA